MKKKSTSQSAFFNLRVLVGLFVALAGLSLLALGALATGKPAVRGASAKRVVAPSPGKYKVPTQSGWPALVPPMFDCSKIRQLGIDKMENFRAGAIMIHCGLAKGGDPETGLANSGASWRLLQTLRGPWVYGGPTLILFPGLKIFPTLLNRRH